MTYRTDPGSYLLGRHLAREEEAVFWASHHCIACTRCEEKYEAIRELRNFIGRKSEAGLPATGLYTLEDEAEKITGLVDEACRGWPEDVEGPPPQDRVHDFREYMFRLQEVLEDSLPESSCDYHRDCGQH